MDVENCCCSLAWEWRERKRERDISIACQICGPVAQKAHFSFVAQTNQKCIAWTSQPNLLCLSSTESGAELSQLTPMHAQLLASNSLCSSSCTNSRRCQGKHRMISLQPQKLDDWWGVKRSNENRNPNYFWRWSGSRENNTKSLPVVGISNLIFLCSWQVFSYTANRVSIAFLEPNVQLVNPKPPNLPRPGFLFPIRSCESIFWCKGVGLCISFVCVRFSHIICPSCRGSLLPVPPAPPPAPPPLPHAPSIPFSTRSSGGVPQAQQMPILKCLMPKWLGTPTADVKHNNCVSVSTEMLSFSIHKNKKLIVNTAKWGLTDNCCWKSFLLFSLQY